MSLRSHVVEFTGKIQFHNTRDKTNRTPATRSSDFVTHSCDYKPNWTPLSPVIITNNNDDDDDDDDDNDNDCLIMIMIVASSCARCLCFKG